MTETDIGTHVAGIIGGNGANSTGSNFKSTCMATPMVSGAAALLLYPVKLPMNEDCLVLNAFKPSADKENGR